MMNVVSPIVLFLLLTSAQGCGYGKPACTVIDAAAQACTVVRYLGPDGKVVEEPVSADKLTEQAKAQRKARLGHE